MEIPDSIKAIGEQVAGGGEVSPAPELFEAYDVFSAELAQVFTQPWLAVDHASRLAAEGYTLGLVSNAPPETARLVDQLGLPRYIKHIVISGVVGYTKPNPEIFKIALGLAGADAREAVHVGDLYEADVIGARNAGITGILLDRDGNLPFDDCPRIAGLGEIYGLLGAVAEQK